MTSKEFEGLENQRFEGRVVECPAATRRDRVFAVLALAAMIGCWALAATMIVGWALAATMIVGLLWAPAGAADVDLANAIRPRLIQVDGYAYAPSSITGSASYSIAYVTRASLAGNAQRTGFRADKQMPEAWRARVADYAGTIYDVGHLEPFRYMGRQAAANDTFIITNAVPENSALNRGVLSRIEARAVATLDGDTAGEMGFWDVTIPLYHYPDDVPIKRIGRVAVPTDLAKMVLVVNKGQPQRLLNWLVPNIDPAGKKPDDFRVSLATIERESQWDFSGLVPLAAREGLEHEP